MTEIAYAAHPIRSTMRVIADDEIDLVNGGIAPLVAVAGVAAVFAALNAAESFGEKLGRALYYAIH